MSVFVREFVDSIERSVKENGPIPNDVIRDLMSEKGLSTDQQEEVWAMLTLRPHASTARLSSSGNRDPSIIKLKFNCYHPDIAKALDNQYSAFG